MAKSKKSKSSPSQADHADNPVDSGAAGSAPAPRLDVFRPAGVDSPQPDGQLHPALTQTPDAEVPLWLREALVEIIEELDRVCPKKAGQEFTELCHRLATMLATIQAPLDRGTPKAWAAGIAYTLAELNQLDDPELQPCWPLADVGRSFGVPTRVAQEQASEILDCLMFMPIDLQWLLPDRLAKNPLAQLFSNVEERVSGGELSMQQGLTMVVQALVECDLVPAELLDEDLIAETASLIESANPAEGLATLLAARLQQFNSDRPTPTDQILQFRVTLKDIDPPIWRQIQVPDGTLLDLHDCIQAAMGWEDAHLYLFRIADREYADLERAVDDDWIDADSILLSDLIPDNPRKKLRFEYLYDFGDDWYHEVLFEGVVDRERRVRYPRCIAGAGACPPEDIGGPYRYDNLIRAVEGDPDANTEVLDWIGWFDPDKFSTRTANRRLRQMYE